MAAIINGVYSLSHPLTTCSYIIILFFKGSLMVSGPWMWFILPSLDGPSVSVGSRPKCLTSTFGGGREESRGRTSSDASDSCPLNFNPSFDQPLDTTFDPRQRRLSHDNACCSERASIGIANLPRHRRPGRVCFVDEISWLDLDDFSILLGGYWAKRIPITTCLGLCVRLAWYGAAWWSVGFWGRIP